MNFAQALHVLRLGGRVTREGRVYVASKDDRGRIFGGILDVTDEEPTLITFSDDDRTAEDWIDVNAPPEPVAPEIVDEALTERVDT